MNLARWGRCALGFAVALAGASAATAMEPIERSGNTFHVAVCARNIGPGEARCYAHVATDARGEAINGRARSSATGPVSGYGPADLKTAYVLPSTGSGTPTVAIVDAYGYPGAESDLAVYRTHYGLGDCTTANLCFSKVDQTGGKNYPRSNSGWEQETALDLDMVSAMCPNCHIVLVEANSSSLANLGAAVNQAATYGPVAISNSYGGGETGSASYNGDYNHSGIAVTVSSGDSGYGVQFPASSQYVIAVGGTTLANTASNGRLYTETAWASGGSGCSGSYPAVQPAYAACLNNRAEADISAVADPNTGVAVYGPNHGTSQWLVFGGTSVSAPLIGGIYGLVGHGVPLSQLQTAPYTYPSSKIYNSASSSFFDIVQGKNGSCGTSNCQAGTGYDGPTGMGTPHGIGAF